MPARGRSRDGGGGRRGFSWMPRARGGAGGGDADAGGCGRWWDTPTSTTRALFVIVCALAVAVLVLAWPQSVVMHPAVLQPGVTPGPGDVQRLRATATAAAGHGDGSRTIGPVAEEDDDRAAASPHATTTAVATPPATHTPSPSLPPSPSSSVAPSPVAAAPFSAAKLSVAAGGVELDLSAAGRAAAVVERWRDYAGMPLPATCDNKFPLTNQRLENGLDAAVKGWPVWQYEDQVAGRVPVHEWVRAQLDVGKDADDAKVQALNVAMSPRTRFGPASLSRYCGSRGTFQAPHTPVSGCPGEQSPTQPSFVGPWCFPPTQPIHIFSADCAIVESYHSHGDVAFTMLVRDGILSTNNDRMSAANSVDVHTVDEVACIGPVSYPWTAGHFPNENMPSYLFMDRALPSHIPLLWASGEVSSAWLALFREAGLLNPNRTIIEVPHTPTYYLAKRLYYLRVPRKSGETPYIAWYTQRLLTQVLTPLLTRKYGEVQQRATLTTVTVLMRRPGGSRYVTNHGEMVSAIKEIIPGATVHEFEPDAAIWEVGRKVRSSCLLIGPHGANMNNLMFLAEGCWVVEIGFIDGGFSLPTDYYCFARNLGHTYWLSVATSGSYGAPMTADIDDIRHIIRAYKAEVVDVGGPTLPTRGL